MAIKANLYPYYTSTEGTHPIRLRVTANRSSRFYPLQVEGKNLFLSPEDWEKVQVDKPKGNFKKVKDIISDAESAARQASKQITQGSKPFDFARFENEFFHQESKKGFFEIFENFLEELKEAGRIGTYVSYKNAMVAFKSFRHDRDLKPEELTAEVLKNFDHYLSQPKTIIKSNGKTAVRKPCNRTSIGIYMRALKVIYNECILRNPDLAKSYPFSTKKRDKSKYRIKTGSGHKGEALTKEQLQSFIKTTPIETSQEWIAKQMWLLSFYCQGMNFRDLLYLKYKNIHGDLISYIRRKTKDTEDKESVMEIPLSDPIREIIVQLGNDQKHSESYVFDVLKKGMTTQREDVVIKQKIKLTNKYLKSMCKSFSLPEITTYWARHSYASLLKDAQISTDMIKELLGHSDVKTTEAYLKRFDINKKREVNNQMHAIVKAS